MICPASKPCNAVIASEQGSIANRVLSAHRALVFNQQGTMCLSGSSDHTIRLWDLGQQRCVQTFAVHTDSVWCLHADAAFATVISGGRDRNIYR